MNRYTYGNLLPELARIAGVSGMNVSDARVMSYANLATQELMNEWDWPQLICRMHFKTSTGRINVPSEFDRIISLNVNGVPQAMQSPWFEFVGYGPGYPNTLGAPTTQFDQNQLGQLLEGVLDKEQVATFVDIPSDSSAYYPTVYCSANEKVNGVRTLIILQGYDQNGQWIRSIDVNNPGVYIDGIQLALNGDSAPFASTTTQAFSVVTAVMKPVTNGYVTLYVSGTQLNVFIASYAPYDQCPYYRRYQIPNLTNGTTYCILARLRKRYAPIVAANDFLLIPNLAALSTMMQAVYYREASNFQLYEQYKAAAVDILKKEMTAYIGKAAQKPLITVNEGLGVRNSGLYVI